MTETKKPQPLPVRPRSGGIWTVLALVIIGGIIALKFVEQPANNSDGADSSDESSATPRHLVVISIDTLRADYLGCYGKKDANTPNIDSLAKDGVLFEKHFSNYPLTLPAHLTQLTGVSSLGHRVRDNLYHRMPSGISTLPESLKKSGFKTGAFVSAHTMKSGSGIERGFDVYDDKDVRELQPGKLTVSERKAEVTLKLAADWFASTGGERAFAFIHLFDPHAPYQPQSIAGTTMDNTNAERYAGEITYVDQQIGVFMDRLRKIEMLDNTLIVITSDHGEGLGQHDELTHGYFCYDTCTHVPLIMRGGGDIKADTRVPSIVRNYDLAPTLIGLMGVESEAIKKQAHGVSLVPLINEPDKDIGLNAYVESHYAYLNANWAKIRGLRTKDGLALFSGNESLLLTGQEQTNVSTDAAAIEGARTEIKRLLSSWLPPSESKSNIRESVAGSPYPGESPVAQDFEPESLTDTKDLPSPHQKAQILRAYQQAELEYDAGRFNVCAAQLRELLSSDASFLMGHKLLAAVAQSLASREKDRSDAIELTKEAVSSLEKANQILTSNDQQDAAKAVRANLALLYVWLNESAKLASMAKEDEPKVYWLYLISQYIEGREQAATQAELFLNRGTLKGGALAQAQAHLKLMQDGQPISLAPWEQ